MAFFHEQSRQELRAAYASAWRKTKAGEILTPLESQIAHVVGEHPEYQAMLEGSVHGLDAQFAESGAENPFLHLGLHLAVREQVSTDRPAGIARIHALLSAQLGSAHAAEHRMFEALGKTLWEASRSGKAPDESAYLDRLRGMISG